MGVSSTSCRYHSRQPSIAVIEMINQSSSEGWVETLRGGDVVDGIGDEGGEEIGEVEEDGLEDEVEEEGNDATRLSTTKAQRLMTGQSPTNGW